MSRPASALSTPAPVRASAPLDTARSVLLAAAPAAAAVLVAGTRDECTREQIQSAESILNRVGLRSDASAPAPHDVVASSIAQGVFSALLEHFGLPRVVRSADAGRPHDDDVVPVESTVSPLAAAPQRLSASLGRLSASPGGKEGSPAPRPAPRRRTTRKKEENDDETFLANLDVPAPSAE